VISVERFGGFVVAVTDWGVPAVYVAFRPLSVTVAGRGAIVKVALALHPQELSIKLLYFKALIATDSHEAEALGENLLTSFAGNWEVQYLNGVLDTNCGRLRQGRRHLEQSVNLNPNSAASHAALALVLAQLNDIPAAKEQQQKAIVLGDNSEEVNRTLSKLPQYLEAAVSER